MSESVTYPIKCTADERDKIKQFAESVSGSLKGKITVMEAMTALVDEYNEHGNEQVLERCKQILEAKRECRKQAKVIRDLEKNAEAIKGLSNEELDKLGLKRV